MTTPELKLFQAAVMQSWNAIVITDADLAAGCRVQIVNPAFCAMTGYTEDELRGRTLKMLQGPSTDAAVIDELRSCLAEARYFEGQATNYRKDGSSYIVRWNVSPVRNDEGMLTHFVSVQQDISERVSLEQALRVAATRDTLTALYNRRHGQQLLDEAHRRARLAGGALSLIVCDIDHFKRINDRFGHPAGDRALVSVAGLVQQSVRSRDRVIRWGGEEFVILLENCTHAPAMALGERIRSRVGAHREPDIGAITVSLGLATLQAGETMEQLLARADAALYEAKRRGRNRLAVAATDA